MEKHKVFTFGIFFVFLLSLTLVNATYLLNQTIDFKLEMINGLPNFIEAEKNYELSVEFNHLNESFNEGITLVFRGTDFVLPSNDTIGPNQSEIYDLKLTVPKNVRAREPFSRTLFVDVYNETNILETLSVGFSSTINSFCQDLNFSNEVGDLEIVGFDILNFGDGYDDEWFLLDRVEIEVIVENSGDNTIFDIIAEIKVLDSAGNDVTRDFDFNDETINLRSIARNREKTARFVIPQVPIELRDGVYYIYVAVYSETENHCVSNSRFIRNYGSNYYAVVSVEREHDRGIIVKNLMKELVVSCGQRGVELDVELWNIGEDRERYVLVQLLNNEIGINEKRVISNFRAGRKNNVLFNFDIPEDIEEKMYTLEIITYFDYDRGDEFDFTSYYENSYFDLEEDYLVRLDVLSCYVPEPIIQARLISDDVIVDEEVLIEVSVTNTMNKVVDYSFLVVDYERWSDLVSIQPSSFSLAPGETREFTIKFIPILAGEHNFNVRIVGDGRVVVQDITLNVTEKRKTPDRILDLFGEDFVYYLIVGALVLLILFLIILIIIVIARRR